MSEAATEKPVVRMTRELAASPDLVFDAWTDPQMVRQWFAPGEMAVTLAEIDLRVGGAYALVMQGEQSYRHTGVYREIERPRRLVFTWSSSATEGTETLVTIEIEPRGEGSLLILTHEGFADDAMAEKHLGGWTGCLAKLVPFVED